MWQPVIESRTTAVVNLMVPLATVAAAYLAGSADGAESRGTARNGLSRETEPQRAEGLNHLWGWTHLCSLGARSGGPRTGEPECIRRDGAFRSTERSGKSTCPYPRIAKGRVYLRDHDDLLGQPIRRTVQSLLTSAMEVR